MPDITMCSDETCPMKMECYRYRAIPDKHMQTYFLDSPRKGDECDYFTSIKGWGNLRNINEPAEKLPSN